MTSIILVVMLSLVAFANLVAIITCTLAPKISIKDITDAQTTICLMRMRQLKNEN